MRKGRYSKHIPNPVELLHDHRGVYGIGLSEEYLNFDAPKDFPRRCNTRIILRPDRMTESVVRDDQPILQALPPNGLFRHSCEGRLREEMISVMHWCAGIRLGEIAVNGHNRFESVEQQRAFYIPDL
jgi:hypothetical protein